MAIAIFTSLQSQRDTSGGKDILANGGSITVYAFNSTTPLSLFSDSGLSVSAANPIPLDSAGRHDMRYVAAAAYKVLVKNSAGVTIFTRDYIDPGVPIGTGALSIANGGTGQVTGAAALSALGGATAEELADIAADVAALAGAGSSVEKTHIATGTTAQRPGTPAEGDVRRNTTTGHWEFYDTGWRRVILETDSPNALTRTLPTVQRITSGSSATYTTPAGCTYLRVRMVGPGGGGGAQATNAGAAGSADTAFSDWTAVKGNGGAAAGGTPGSGGTSGTDGTGTKINRVSGADGTWGQVNGGATIDAVGGIGGSSVFGGAGRNGAAAAGQAAKTNSGSGGGAASPSTGASNAGGSGGGAGEFVEFFITSPAASYTYTVGSGGAGGSAGTLAGGAGAAGIIIVEEFYF